MHEPEQRIANVSNLEPLSRRRPQRNRSVLGDFYCTGRQSNLRPLPQKSLSQSAALTLPASRFGARINCGGNFDRPNRAGLAFGLLHYRVGDVIGDDINRQVFAAGVVPEEKGKTVCRAAPRRRPGPAARPQQKAISTKSSSTIASLAA